ncbi:hypothetical protein [Streptomyces exfoliatus]|uniref:hypothetical protein n=1 Tax=Streptomyces TaxID=1883 RepID=UPI0004C6E5D1|nr:hypothetical protein [Streptomyces exfoliatus]
MGVFAVFRRKKKDVAAVSPETASEEAGTAAVAETPVEDGDAASGVGGPETVASTEVTDAEAEDADETVAAETVEAAADAVEIPKQQSAEAAADNEAGEGVRR